MVRVVRPGGSVSAYAWDMLGGGFPYAAVSQELVALGSPALLPPSVDASRIEAMSALWQDAGLVDVETRTISVSLTYASFDEFWRIAQTGPRVAPRVAALTPADVALLQDRLRARWPADDSGRIGCSALANAVKGRVAGRSRRSPPGTP